ncbi:MAG: bifunctional 5,10-methylene-tetrahydrofolate dehydrogenase/5,10-methylene-tetrahydrofolate cyclohydrolase, partial [Cohnella sp.]|nr:bifunctional 5,10-methylene-tetrahydrofolate dehydrogenase/5,10-methylene-tetrahydrofolate cyclohydrolase [Cohnella sp.]
MSAQIIDGKNISDEIRVELRQEVEQLKKQGVTPGLVVILVGEDPASQVYVNNKAKACEQLGYYSEVVRLPAETSQQALLDMIDKYNRSAAIHGILVQLPVPKQIDPNKIIATISPDKDVD